MFNQKLILKIAFILAIIGGSLFITSKVQAKTYTSGTLQIECDEPIFNEVNLVPGDISTKQVKVTNLSLTKTQDLYLQATNSKGSSSLPDVLNMTISLGSTILYQDYLSELLAHGNVYIATLAPQANVTFEIKAYFDKEAGNKYQEQTSIFDIAMGFIGQTTPPPLPPYGGGGTGTLSLSTYQATFDYIYPFQKTVGTKVNETILITNTGTRNLEQGILTITFPNDYLTFNDNETGTITQDIPIIGVDRNYLVTFTVLPNKYGVNITSQAEYKSGDLRITKISTENISQVAGETTAPPSGGEAPSSVEESPLSEEAGFIPSFGGILGSTISRLKRAFVPQVFSEETEIPKGEDEEVEKSKVLGVEDTKEETRLICSCCFPCWLFWLMLVALIILLLVLLLFLGRYRNVSRSKKLKE